MTERTHPNPLTIAYLAIGARNYLENHDDASKRGEKEFINSVIGHALMLDRKADLVDNGVGFAGCFEYEVAEFFGSQCAEHLSLGWDFDAEAAADELIEAAS